MLDALPGSANAVANLITVPVARYVFGSNFRFRTENVISGELTRDRVTLHLARQSQFGTELGSNLFPFLPRRIPLFATPPAPAVTEYSRWVAEAQRRLAAGPITDVASFPRPPGVPADWIARLSDSGGGVLYRHPTNRHHYVRVMPADLTSPFPASRVPYVRWQVNGRALDMYGRSLPTARLPEAHIPLADFRYALP